MEPVTASNLGLQIPASGGLGLSVIMDFDAFPQGKLHN
jgi:hypothetical protein